VRSKTLPLINADDTDQERPGERGKSYRGFARIKEIAKIAKSAKDRRNWKIKIKTKPLTTEDTEAHREEGKIARDRRDQKPKPYR
jgi:hypothetical protein